MKEHLDANIQGAILFIMNNAISYRVIAMILTLGLTASLLGYQMASADQGMAKVHENHAAACPGPAAKDDARCHARVVTDGSGAPKTSAAPSGFGPAQLRGAYSVSGVGGNNRIIAIVDAYNDPNIKSDLDTYSAQFGIPTLPNCVGPIANSSIACFQKTDQRGGTAYPQTNAGWALEIALDVEVAHAMCQDCSILLVEADSASFLNLMTAVDRAVSLGAVVVSNSYGASEFSGETSYDFHFNRPGVAFTVSSGDSGYGTEYPAASQYVTAVGGTTLTLGAGNTYFSESVWSGSGSGCSAYEPKPLWQTDTGCTHRTIADVSAVADPNTGAAVYDSVRYQGRIGWYKVGGTSLSSPLIASIYALSGNIPAATQENSLPYLAGSGTLHDVQAGSNGSCGGSYLCTGVIGYDGPTGLGSPNGTLAF